MFRKGGCVVRRFDEHDFEGTKQWDCGFQDSVAREKVGILQLL